MRPRWAGATQPIVLGGLDYNADLTQLLTHVPSDGQHQLIASGHVYDFVEGSDVDAMFTGQLEPIAQHMPVIRGWMLSKPQSSLLRRTF